MDFLNFASYFRWHFMVRPLALDAGSSTRCCPIHIAVR